MKIINMLYENGTHLTDFIKGNTFDPSYSWLVRVYASSCEDGVCTDITSTIKSLIPSATVIGCTVGGVIYNGEIHDNGTLIVFTGFEKATVTSFRFSIEGLDDAQIADKIATSAEDFKSALGIIHIGANSPYTEKVVRRISKSMPHIILAGGVAGCPDESGEDNSLVFDHEGIYENTISITYITNDFMLAYTNAVVGHRAISDIHKITAMTGNYLDEINGIPAVNWIVDTLGTAKMSEDGAGISNDVLLKFPFVLEGEDGSSRFFEYDKEQDKIMQHHSRVDVGTDFRIGYVSPVNSAEQWLEICYDLQETPVEALFFYSCYFRKLFLNNLSKWELTPFEGMGVCGAFMFGEISTTHSAPRLYNGTCTILTMAEQASYIKPNLSAYDRVAELVKANEEISKTLQDLVITTNTTDPNSLLINAIKSEAQGIERLSSSGGTMTDFLKQRGQNDNLKLCLVCTDIEKLDKNAVAIEGLTATLNKMSEYAKENFGQFEVKFYSLNRSSFFFTTENSVADGAFISVVNGIYSAFKEDGNLNFAMTLQGVNPHDLRKYIEENSKDGRSELFSVDKSENKESDLQSEFEIVKKIKDALRNDRVVPYFQGIYDNRKNKFFAFEALMRIQTEEGDILPPGVFLEVAKKHGLYLDLSRVMICKVLDMFKDRNEIISMNLSSLDIHSPVFMREVVSRLEKMENPSHFIFELVETEQFARQEALRRFIRKLRQYGCKIAIDDFGSGYSNFIEIGNLEIDYIKINGSLTELLGTDVSYNQILESIYFLSKKMRVELIAECVETAAMQKALVSGGVRYSQGYLFSRPMPIDEFNIVAEEHAYDQEDELSESSESNIIEEIVDSKSKNMRLIWGGIATLIVIFVSIYFFSANNLKTVGEISDAFLVEMAVNMADKISQSIEDATDFLHGTESAVASHYPDMEGMTNVLGEITEINSFDDIYIKQGDNLPVNSMGVNLRTDKECDLSDVPYGEVKISPPLTDLDSGRQLFTIGTRFRETYGNTAELHGVFYLDNFSEVLNLKNFGGEAFYHLCQIDGAPLVLSGNSDNLFAGGDMYTFIGSLDIQNGHTPESIREDMEDGNSVVLKYNVAGEQRTAVMVTVPGTEWCVVSILLDDVTVQMANSIGQSTYIFAVAMIGIFAIYFIFTISMSIKTEKTLKRALEASYYLTNSLQSTIETDSLTNTYSRATAQEKIAEVVSRSGDSGMSHTLIIADADNFKGINDTYGHQIGDRYLMEFASAIKSSLRAGDILGRLGGDEFIVLLNNVGGKENARNVINRILSSVSSISIKDVDLEKVGISIGAVMIPEHSTDYTELNLMADKALYVSKNSGKSTFSFYGERMGEQ